MTWEERYTEREPLFACVTCSAILRSPAALSDGSDIRCRACDGEPGAVEPVNVEEANG